MAADREAEEARGEGQEALSERAKGRRRRKREDWEEAGRTARAAIAAISDRMRNDGELVEFEFKVSGQSSLAFKIHCLTRVIFYYSPWFY